MVCPVSIVRSSAGQFVALRIAVTIAPVAVLVVMPILTLVRLIRASGPVARSTTVWAPASEVVGSIVSRKPVQSVLASGSVDRSRTLRPGSRLPLSELPVLNDE